MVARLTSLNGAKKHDAAAVSPPTARRAVDGQASALHCPYNFRVFFLYWSLNRIVPSSLNHTGTSNSAFCCIIASALAAARFGKLGYQPPPLLPSASYLSNSTTSPTPQPEPANTSPKMSKSMVRSVKNVTKGYSQVQIKVRNGKPFANTHTHSALPSDTSSFAF